MTHIHSHILSSPKLFVVTRKRSFIGLPAKYKAACMSLGLRKLHHTHLIPPSPKVVGNLALLRNLVTIKYVEGGPFKKETLETWLNERGKRASLGFYIESKGPFSANGY